MSAVARRTRGAAAGRSVVSVRMYNVGFGDAFLVTVRRGDASWRMLVDCGVHSQGRARPLDEVVDAIIADLAADEPSGTPSLDVLVATHHHADHIAGFALDAWQQVAVAEVWLPFVEDPDDRDAQALRTGHAQAAQALLGIIRTASHDLHHGQWPAALVEAQLFAVNSLRNEDATDRLLSRNGRGFGSTPRVRFLPSLIERDNTLPTGLDDVSVHVLGPSRDPAQLKRMDPPAAVAWLDRGPRQRDRKRSSKALFSPQYVVTPDQVPDDLLRARRSLRLAHLTDDTTAVLEAAAALEGAVNNTSLFLVLDVAGTRLVFPGDSQQGAWDHVLDRPAARALVASPAFYKISHHGSGNATPRRYVDEDLGKGAYAMLPWGLVERWRSVLPRRELLDALAGHHTHVIRSDAPVAEPRVTVHDTLWSELTLTAG